ncbi:MAG TPA: cytochrome P450 [Solirubrobacterales bacterium]|nr:cytochrome P450 [Solirubrobacterales bacterium]
MTLPPGPKAPAAFQTSMVVARPIPFFERCRQRFGGTFTVRVLRMGELVFISDPPSLKSLFAADRKNTIAPGRNVVLAPVLGQRSLLLLEGGEHLRRRKLMLPPFHGERMRAYEGVMEEATRREIASWPLQKPFPLHPSMQRITLEVILRAVFGVEDDERRQALRENLVAILATTRSPRAVGLTIGRLRRLPAYRRVEQMLADTDEALLAEIAERRSDPELERREDILSLLVAARFEDGSAMSDTELRDQLMTLLMAGHETTATALAWAFDLLFRAPQKLERLRAEVAEGGHEYLDAVIEETLRVRPVVPFVGRKLQLATELGGYRLPEGTVVMPAIYLTHTREDVYTDAHAFKPERFLDGGPETYSWIPFGGGTRRCIGGAFAQFEMRAVLRTVLGQAELRPAKAEPEPIVRRNVTLSPRNGTPAILVGTYER